MARSEDEGKASSFIRERVIKDRYSRHERAVKFAAKFFTIIAAAAVFGAVAGVVFSLVDSRSSRLEGESSEQETLSIPRDEDVETEPATEETEPQTEPESQVQIEDVVQSVIDGVVIDLEVGDYEKLYDKLAQIAVDINKSVVTVSYIEERTDWFNNSVESGRTYAGIVWNITDKEVLIAAVGDFEENSELEVNMLDNVFASGYVKGYDKATKLAVIAVPVNGLPVGTTAVLKCIKLGNSYIISAGEPVIVAGNPTGYIGSYLYGNISYMVENMMVPDMSQKGLMLNVTTYSGGNGFAINYSGELIGFYGADNSGEFTKVFGISDLKGVLEALANGEHVAYLGIVGYGVNDKIADRYGLVRGVFVTDIVYDEAAYKAGLMNGDIIVACDGDQVFTLHSLQNMLEARKTGDTVVISVMRNSTDGYQQVDFELELGSR